MCMACVDGFLALDEVSLHPVHAHTRACSLTRRACASSCAWRVRVAWVQVYALLMELGEEPRSHATWDVLDQNAAGGDLISQSEFLVFVSIKRNDDEAMLSGSMQANSSIVTEAMKADLQKRRRQAARRSALRRHTLSRFLLLFRASQLRNYLRRVYVDRLPSLGQVQSPAIARLLPRSPAFSFLL